MKIGGEMEVFIIGCMSVSDDEGDMIEAFMVIGGVSDEVSCWPHTQSCSIFPITTQGTVDLLVTHSGVIVSSTTYCLKNHYSNNLI